MGITGLLPQLKGVITEYHIEGLRGKTAAVDGYAWLHKAVYGCAADLCNGVDTTQWISYCVKLIGMLEYHGISVIMTFDGNNLPAKRGTEEERSASRRANMERGRECARVGDHDGARKFFVGAVNITPLMAARLIAHLRSSNPRVRCIVAPFEADAQLAYLTTEGIADVVIAEDSDTIPYGCKEVIFKLRDDGRCERLVLADLYTKVNPPMDLSAFSQDMVRVLCVGAGCDYLPSVRNVGIKNCYKLLVKTRSAAGLLKRMRLQGLLPLRFVSGDSGVLEYEEGFHRALLTFRHQAVYDPRSGETVHLAPLSIEDIPPCIRQGAQSLQQVDLSFLGSMLEPGHARGVAEGRLDPLTLLPFKFAAAAAAHPSSSSASNSSSSYRASSAKVSKDTVRSKDITSFLGQAKPQGASWVINQRAAPAAPRFSSLQPPVPTSSSKRAAEAEAAGGPPPPSSKKKRDSSSSFFAPPKDSVLALQLRNRESARERLQDNDGLPSRAHVPSPPPPRGQDPYDRFVYGDSPSWPSSPPSAVAPTARSASPTRRPFFAPQPLRRTPRKSPVAAANPFLDNSRAAVGPATSRNSSSLAASYTFFEKFNYKGK